MVISDSIVEPPKSNVVARDSLEKRHSPRKAALFSMIIPGLGQVYNQKYLKIPIFYALGAVTIGFSIKEHKEYKLFQTVSDLHENDEDYSKYNEQLLDLNMDNPSQFKNNRDDARNARDMMYVYTGLVYVLNIVDAVVGAHLKEFTVSDDLSLRAEPTLLFTNNKPATGVALTLNF